MKLLVALLGLQLCFAGFHIVSRVALNIGISKVVYAIYRNFVALTLIAPFAYFLEKEERPPLTFSLLVQFFLLALLGITATQGFYLLGLYNTSPTFASAMQNSVPATTFLMASTLGIEKLDISTRKGLAKVMGTIASVGGATVITLYKGPAILHQEDNDLVKDLTVEKMNWTWGCIYLVLNCLAISGWMVFQGPMIKKYPAKLTLASFTCLFGLIQLLVISAFIEKDLNGWLIQSKEGLFTILYAGMVSPGLALSLQAWGIQKGGPVFVAGFQPIQTVFVAIMASVLLGDELYSGAVIGTILIMIGLYSVLWGKTQENRDDHEETLTRHLLEDETKKKEIDTAAKMADTASTSQKYTVLDV